MLGAGGHEDRRHVTQAIHFAHLLKGLATGHAGHHHVEQDHIGRIGLNLIQRRFPGLALDDVEIAA